MKPQERFFTFWGVKVRGRVLRRILGASVAFLCACTTLIPVPSQDTWSCQYCKNTEIHQTGTGFWFDFPGSDGVHYVTKSATKGSGTITATFTITGTGKIVSEGGGTPQVRLYFQRRGDDMMATKGTTEFYRWWSVQTCLLKNGTFTLSVPLTSGKWQSVYGITGDKAVKQFNDAWNNAQVAGMTFGDQYGAGHGVHAASGSLKFTMTSFTIK